MRSLQSLLYFAATLIPPNTKRITLARAVVSASCKLSKLCAKLPSSTSSTKSLEGGVSCHCSDFASSSNIVYSSGQGMSQILQQTLLSLRQNWVLKHHSRWKTCVLICGTGRGRTPMATFKLNYYTNSVPNVGFVLKRNGPNPARIPPSTFQMIRPVNGMCSSARGSGSQEFQSYMVLKRTAVRSVRET